MEKEVTLNEQMEDLDFYKSLQKERSVTEKHRIEGYRKDIEEYITDENIKKQAIATVDLIESELEENQRLYDEVEDEEKYNDDFNPMSFVEEDKDLEGESGALPGSPQPYEEEESEIVEMPHFEVTDVEREAIIQTTAFNDSQRLSNIESSVVSTPNEATKVSKQDLNVAKEGINNLKKGISKKLENVDAEKLDGNWQKFWFLLLDILKTIINYTAIIAVAFYKIPAKRHYKKKLDYSLSEASNKFRGKNILETGQNEMKHRFLVDYLPKLILLLSALLVYNEVWKVGLVTFVIGFIYYLITDATFDYGGSRLLNILAIYMDKEGIRLKDAYYTNMIVLYRYFDEYQKAMGVTIDENAGIDITDDPNLGYILHFYVNEDRNTSITSITDHKLTYYKVVPFLDSYNKTAKLQNKRQVAVMLDQILLMAINQDENVSELYAKKEEYWDYFPELRALAEAKRLEEEARLIKEEREKVKRDITKLVVDKGINENAVNVITMIHDRKRDWKFNVWNVSDNSIVGNKNYMKIRCIFNQSGNLTNVKKLQDEIETKFRCGIMIKEVDDKGSFDLYVIFVPKLDKYKMKVRDLKIFNDKDEIFIGNSLSGPLSTSWNHQANHALIAGGSGAGKSVQITTFMAQLSNLKSFDYKTMFISSSSKMSDFTPFIEKGAAGFEGPDEQEKLFTYILELLKEREREFTRCGVKAIKGFNEKYPEKPMRQILLVADEWENSRNGLDSKQSGRLEKLMVQILNIARSSGCLVILGGQSILKSAIGIPLDKMFIRFSGTNKSNILRTVDPEIAHYFDTLVDHIGVFFFDSQNTPPTQEKINYGKTTFSLVQTPFVTDIDYSKDIPQLSGQEFMAEILNGEVDLDLDVQEVTSYNVNDVKEAKENNLEAGRFKL